MCIEMDLNGLFQKKVSKESISDSLFLFCAAVLRFLENVSIHLFEI